MDDFKVGDIVIRIKKDWRDVKVGKVYIISKVCSFNTLELVNHNEIKYSRNNFRKYDLLSLLQNTSEVN